jgi:CRP-like cAMP-binding protein
MHEALIKYIDSYTTTPLTKSETELIQRIFIIKKYKKKQFLLQEGDVCKYFAFIVKGAMRQYSVDQRGIEHIIAMYIENWWAGDRESFVMLTPSVYNIDAWEGTEVLLITRADQLKYLNPIPAFAELARNLDDRNYIATQKRLKASISLSAEERYAEFAKSHPAFLNRFPQHMIASYLGFTKETLSRVRKQALKK